MVKRPKKITLGKKLGGKKNNSNNQTGKVESLIIFRCNCRCLMCSTGLQIDRSRHDTDYHAIRPFEDVKKDIEIEFPKINKDEIKRIMMEHEFSEERIDSQLKKLEEIKEKRKQKGLNDYFK